MTRRGLDPKDVKFEKIGGWNSVLYDIPVPGGRNVNVRAEWVRSGTWIDVHLSLTADLPSLAMRTRLRDCVKGFQVTEKAQ